MRISGRKKPVFENIIELSLQQMFNRCEYLANKVDEGTNIDDNKEAEHIIKDVWSIEKEWILNDKYWKQMTAFSVEE
tara:strand:- start:506 stop:736 length:231 start_codon:yes stop_codon:yes gene_type:complete